MEYLGPSAWTQYFRSTTPLTERKLDSFRHLRSGWNFGEGDAFRDDVVDLSMKIYQLFNRIGLTTTDAVPGLTGQIKLLGYKDSRQIRVEFFVEDARAATLIVRENRKIITEERHVAIPEAITRLIDVSELWNTLGLSIQPIIIWSIRNRLIQWHSVSQQKTDAPQYFNVNAWMSKQVGAALLGNIQNTLEDSRRSSGNLTSLPYQMDIQ